VNAFLRLLRYAAPFKGRLTVALLAMVVYAAGSVGLAYLTKRIFDDVLLGGQAVGEVAALILGAYFLKGIGGYISGYVMTDVGQRVVMEVRNRLYRHLLDQSAAFFSRRTSGHLLSRITNDVSQVQLAVSETAPDLLRESLSLVGFAGYLFFLDRGQEQLAHLTHVAAEGLTGHRIVKAFGAEGREAARFGQASHELFRTTMKITSAVSALPPLMEFIGGLAAVGALWYGTRRIGLGLMTPGEFTSFLTAAFMMYGPMKKLSRVNASLQQTIAASERIFETLDTHTEVHDKPGAPALGRLQTAVEFRDVGFAYEDDPARFVLRHASFRVKAGQLAAVVGLSGAGKTTLVNLIPRFYDVSEGRIEVDGVDIRDVSLRSLRDQTALVTQETVLFDDTIAANIAYGRPAADADQVERAARAAHAHEFIVQWPEGYQTRIGERGQLLSGGQRQRLAIARAILKDCPLLVLDEATSSLDAESELLVQDALANLMRNRTTFVIAHRLSTVRRADLIVALEKGHVAEIGTHDDLVNRPGGVYARLYALQAFDDRGRVVVEETRGGVAS
jgi:subfamily B ATP-binding cassette protein MsbA